MFLIDLKSLTHLSMSPWEDGEGDMLNPSKSADSRIALFFLRPGQGGTIMSALELVTEQLLHGSGPIIPPPAPGTKTQPGGQRLEPAPVAAKAAPGSLQPAGHTTVAATQPQPAEHILTPAIAIAIGLFGAGGSKGLLD